VLPHVTADIGLVIIEKDYMPASIVFPYDANVRNEYIAVDSCMSDLMRPGMYGSYHEVTVAGKENAPKTE